MHTHTHRTTQYAFILSSHTLQCCVSHRFVKLPLSSSLYAWKQCGPSSQAGIHKHTHTDLYREKRCQRLQMWAPSIFSARTLSGSPPDSWPFAGFNRLRLWCQQKRYTFSDKSFTRHKTRLKRLCGIYYFAPRQRLGLLWYLQEFSAQAELIFLFISTVTLAITYLIRCLHVCLCRYVQAFFFVSPEPDGRECLVKRD